jgi:hypothetical protein
MLRIGLSVLVLMCLATGGALVPNDTRGQAIKPPAAASPPEPTAPSPGAAPDQGKGHLSPVPPSAAAPEIITDLARLPAPVARMRERILAAARSGDLQRLAALVNEAMPTFSFTDEKDPVAFWKANYPDSGGVEVLSILTMILDLGFVRLDQGTPQEMYVWPYFVGMSLGALSPQQKVELFSIVTGADYKDMLPLGVYSFYRVGIGPDGSWHFFVAGD